MGLEFLNNKRRNAVSSARGRWPDQYVLESYPLLCAHRSNRRAPTPHPHGTHNAPHRAHTAPHGTRTAPTPHRTAPAAEPHRTRHHDRPAPHNRTKAALTQRRTTSCASSKTASTDFPYPTVVYAARTGSSARCPNRASAFFVFL